MEPIEKTRYFEYVLHRLLNWYGNQAADGVNDLSILKSIKLLFFVSAAAGNKEQNQLLDEVFDRYVAMPYGHVESEIYDEIKNRQGQLTYFRIDNNRTQNTQLYNSQGLDHSITGAIDQAVDFLMNVNPNLVKMSSFDLVNLSHAWYSWQKYYSLAKQQGQRSMSIPPEIIKREDKIYSLKTF